MLRGGHQGSQPRGGQGSAGCGRDRVRATVAHGDFDLGVALDGSGDWIWYIDDGWHDCFDGCDCHIYYTFLVTEDGSVTLLDKQQWGMPWCEWPG